MATPTSGSRGAEEAVPRPSPRTPTGVTANRPTAHGLPLTSQAAEMPSSLPRADQVAAVAALDALGVLLTGGAIAAIVTGSGVALAWWVFAALSVLLLVATTGALIGLISQRRGFYRDIDSVAGQITQWIISQEDLPPRSIMEPAVRLYREAGQSRDVRAQMRIVGALEEYARELDRL